MNYRHRFHAANFADVMKHVLLVRLIAAMRKKEKPFLYLDTHAGRGSYDLAAAAEGDTLARKPEWPDGIGRLWDRAEVEPGIAEYLALVRHFDRQQGNLSPSPRFYPGSPWIARELLRPQDRVACCERQPDECAALRAEFQDASRVSVHELDGYGAVRAMLPPAERRALVLIDPPYEEQDEFARIATALGEGLRRLAGGVFVVWYPLTERARLNEFFSAVQSLGPPPTLALELTIAGENASIKMKGCGVVILNPPWRFEHEAAGLLEFLAVSLAQAPGGGARLEWVVPE
jgi:23S rRNA (adenine2030-N6)-methyltransferase